MKVVTLNAEQRDQLGRHAMRKLRMEGKVPAVIYGAAAEAKSIALHLIEVEEHLRLHHKVFKTKVGGSEESLLLQDVQFETTTDLPLHVDFKRIDLTKPLTIPVEIVFLGHAAGLSKGGRIIHDMSDLAVTCLPTQIPESLEVNVGHLDIGMSVVAKDVKLPDGVTLAVEPDAVICHVILHVEKVEAAPAAAPVAEGAAAPGAEGAAAPAAAAAGAKPEAKPAGKDDKKK